MAFKKGQSGNPAGRLPGVPNRATKDFKQAVTSLLENLGPEMEDWIKKVAKKNPARAIDCISSLAEYSQPKLSRVTHAGDADSPVLFQRVTDDLVNPNAAAPSQE